MVGFASLWIRHWSDLCINKYKKSVKEVKHFNNSKSATEVIVKL